MLAEKRTSMAEMRTGLALTTVPATILTVLATVSTFFEMGSIFLPIAILVPFSLGLLALGVYMIYHGLKGIRKYDRKIDKLANRDSDVREIVTEHKTLSGWTD